MPCRAAWLVAPGPAWPGPVPPPARAQPQSHLAAANKLNSRAPETMPGRKAGVAHLEALKLPLPAQHLLRIRDTSRSHRGHRRRHGHGHGHGARRRSFRWRGRRCRVCWRSRVVRGGRGQRQPERRERLGGRAAQHHQRLIDPGGSPRLGGGTGGLRTGLGGGGLHRWRQRACRVLLLALRLQVRCRAERLQPHSGSSRLGGRYNLPLPAVPAVHAPLPAAASRRVPPSSLAVLRPRTSS